MTADEKAKFDKWQAEEKEKARLVKQQEDRDTYKELVDEAIEAVFPSGRILSQLFSATKKRIYDSFREVIKLKEEIYGVKEGQQSHTWTHGNGKLRVTLGYNVTDDYDDTASAGVQKVHNYISSLAKDAETRSLVNAVLRLLAKDGKTGTLKNSRILALRKMAEESGNADFIDGVDIIDKAYIPVLSKQYIKMWYKNDINEWVSIPMSMTEAKNSDLSLAEYTQLMEVLNVEFSEFIKPATPNSDEEDKD